ncbi:hypothetical protein LTR37_019388 [Vermiconidia calcicola]|uniref:Uncharacterized protein n=1 Tax=Vermiconidia calcicola TaxID=1690605 RepID=A0ACC3ME80_9PEZI|nr:hypothetical protein LTR37_019388 [Vermiconidia calcicola]
MVSPVGSPPNPFRDRVMSEQRRESDNISSSAEASRPGSAGGRPREKKRVGFTGGSDSAEQSRRVSWINANGASSPSPWGPSPGHMSPAGGSGSGNVSPRHRRTDSGDSIPPQTVSKSHLPELSPQQTKEIHEAFCQHLSIPRPRPAIRQAASAQPELAGEDLEGPDVDGQRSFRQTRMREAFERGKRVEEEQRSTPNSRHQSPERQGPRGSIAVNDIHLDDLSQNYYDTDTDDEHVASKPATERRKAQEHREAQKLVRRHTNARGAFNSGDETPSGFRSGAVTPTEEQSYTEDYRPRPRKYRGGILGSLLKLYKDSEGESGGQTRISSRARFFGSVDHTPDVSNTSTPQPSPPESGTATPTGGTPGKRWYTRKHHNDRRSSASLSQLIGPTTSLGSPVVSGLGEQVSRRLKERKEAEKRPPLSKRTSSGSALAALNRVTRGQRDDREIRITKHIAETIARQKYLMRLCRALMMYGAPTHRLEEYMRMSARVLEIEAQFLYIPGSMIMSFDDQETHTTEVKLVRVSQGLDLGKLRDVHETYKDVVHDIIGVEEATKRLREVMKRIDKHSRWFRIPVYGLAAVCVGPFAFQARLIDLPIAFILGCILGLLQLVVAPASDLYANVFEISAAVITSFLARAFGSIPYKDGRLFCFSALAQSSIALILPGYIVLCASLELQSRSIVAGSVRMVYAVIYSLFLGFGITIGTAIYGIIDENASSQTTCDNPMSGHWYFFFVPGFTLCLIVINQAKWKQAPVMLLIAFVGYIVNYFSSERFQGNTQVSNTLGALAIGVMANGYSRIGSRVENWALDRWEDDLRPYWKEFRRQVFHVQSNSQSAKSLEEGSARDDESMFVRSSRRVGYSLAAAAMLPAIFVQVPSGLAVQGSLVSGIASANQIAGNATNGTTVVNTTTLAVGSDGLNSIAFNVSYSVIQVAIGITVGLFLSAIVVYPLGKRRSGLFSF